MLCGGDRRRLWKGTDTILEAGALLGVRVEGYHGKDLAQGDLGREYDAADVFVVGSWFEGFCQPGLEALACGVPLVTTDNGGCREYAHDGETALVVPPRDARAMADAIDRLLKDETLAKQLATNGLDVVERDFDWERRTDAFAEILDGVAAGRLSAPPPARPAAPVEVVLSVVVLAWDNLEFTQRFVESVRQHTDVSYELIIVDNGSRWEAAHYAEAAADHSIMNEVNLGFARGMNQGLQAARGEFVAFCNNDTILPEGWAGKLIETAKSHPNAAIVVPALTAARNEATVRTEPGNDVEVLDPFSAPPAAVVYVARADVIEHLGAWGEEYEIASGEDVDLCFKVWVNDLDIVYDQRVLVDHIGKGSASRLDDWEGLWARNRQRFLDKWAGDEQPPRLASCDPVRFDRNRAIARATASWMARYFATRDKARQRPEAVRTRRAAPHTRHRAGSDRLAQGATTCSPAGGRHARSAGKEAGMSATNNQSIRPDRPGDALARARELELEGRALEAIDLLTGVNRERRNAKVERELVQLRHRAFAAREPEPGLPEWPVPAPDRFDGVTGLAGGLGIGLVRRPPA